MPMKRCDEGHFYDTAKNASCPTCSDGAAADLPTMRRQSAAPSSAATGDAKTVALVVKKAGIDPVVGWLVCISGPAKGRDYRLHAERNFIGRGEAMDVAIGGDDTISRENHASVSFNPKNGMFKLVPGEGRGLVYRNGAEVDQPTELKAGDKVELGQTTLLFVPLCGAALGGAVFTWDG
jgi:type III secretion system (T3SS) inner membrane Yop/YscD-like protein